MAATGLRRRAFHQAALWLASAVAAPVLHAQPRPEKARLTLAVGGKASLNHLPLTLAEQLGFFKAEGLEVDIVDQGDGALAVQAALAGAAEVVVGAYAETLELQSRGHSYRAFVLLGRAPQIALGVSTRNVPGFRALEQLRGRRIGVVRPGSSSHMIASLALARAGLGSADVRYIATGAGSGAGAGVLAALRDGELDAISHTDPVMTMLEQRGEVRIVSDTRTLRGTQELLGGPMPTCCLYASADFVQRHPQTVQALTHAIVRALKWLQTAGPGDLIKTVPESYMLGDRALYLASFNKLREAISHDGLISDEGARTTLRALADFEALVRSERIDLGRSYTNEFARRAKQRFQA
ncbi:ABC transporter substrate-binding protein [Ramlibacter sp. 2FC]|uniref:ABC transporter substrate-binding protein n=1 Tax=Ramlibacter sp. 2FC TaxID=2502188 RepID=UPI0010F4CBB5|nr:ABC transporter substrate-binding protein [Ramlibacter sp. 2FC]